MKKNKNHLSCLLIEDSLIDAHVIKAALTKYLPYPCHVKHVEDAQEVATLLKGEKSIDLVLLDLKSPEKSGLTNTFKTKSTLRASRM